MAKRPEDLVEAGRHALYEFQMLQVTAIAISSEFAKGSMLNNALLESFLVHTRNLLHFLFPENAHVTDVLAVHFFDEPDRWKRVRGPLPPKLKIVKDRANKRMAHITYGPNEVGGEEKQWGYYGIFDEIQVLVDVFVRNAKQELLHDDWDDVSKSLAARR